MRWLFIILLVLGGTHWASAVLAQDPQVNISADEPEVVIGQPVLVRVEVLVPTFMPTPPVFPTFEVPGLIVRLPERSTVPMSERIDGATWAGVRRTYRIYPMQAGETVIPPQELQIVFKDVDTNEDVPLSVEVPAITINATVPSGARSLDPVILAQGVTIEQSWQGGEGELAVGDALVRRLDVSIAGASPLFIPALLEASRPRSDDPEMATFSAYPEDPVVSESLADGVMSGTRVEQVSYVAQSGGDATFPDVALSWYNIDSGEIEDIVLAGRSFTVAAPPETGPTLDRDAVIQIALLLGVAGFLIWAARRWIWPPLQKKAKALRVAYDATSHAAHKRAEARAKARDLNGLLTALAEREARGLPAGAELRASLSDLTEALYGNEEASASTRAQWVAVDRALRRERPRLELWERRTVEELPPLNPFAETHK